MNLAAMLSNTPRTGLCTYAPWWHVRLCTNMVYHLCTLNQAHFAVPVHFLGIFLWACGGAVNHCVDAHHGGWQGSQVLEVSLQQTHTPHAGMLASAGKLPHYLSRLSFGSY